MLIEHIKSNARFLTGLFIFSLLVRALVFYGYLSQQERYWQVDSNTYHVVAQQLASGKGLTNPDGKNHFYRVPGYAFFLSLYYKVFGVDPKNVLWLQVLLASLLPILVFLLSLVLFPNFLMLAKVSSVWSAFHLGFVLYAGFFMTETLFLFFFLISCLFFFSSFNLFFCPKPEKFPPKQVQKKKPCRNPLVPEGVGESFYFVNFYEKTFPQASYRELVQPGAELLGDQMLGLLLAGIALGFAGLVRPVGHYLLVASLGLLVLSADYWYDKLAKCSVLTLGFSFSVLGWLLRNVILTGMLFFHTLPGGHFLYLSAARVAMHVHQCSYQQARKVLHTIADEMIAEKEAGLGRPLMEIESCKLMEKLSLQYFIQHPWLTLKNWLTDMFRASFSLYSAEILFLENDREQVDYFQKKRGVCDMFAHYLFPPTKKLWVRLLIFIEMLLFFFILLGFLGACVTAFLRFFSQKNSHWLCAVFKVLPFMMLFIVISLSGGYARMRLPLEPFLLVVSLSFWCFIFLKKRARRSNDLVTRL